MCANGMSSRGTSTDQNNQGISAQAWRECSASPKSTKPDCGALVAKHWPMIVAVANRLLKEQTVGGSEILELCERVARNVVRRQHLKVEAAGDKRIRLPDVNAFRDRHGKLRHVFRRRGFKKFPLPGLPGSDEFMSAYRAALAGVEIKLEIGAGRTMPGTVNAAVVGYYTSTTFQESSAGSKKQIRSILERFRNAHGDKRLPLVGAETRSSGCLENCGRTRARIGFLRSAACSPSR